MDINSISTNIADVGGQNLPANNRLNAVAQGEDAANNSGTLVSDGTDSKSVLNKQKSNENQTKETTTSTSVAPSHELFGLTGTLALDADKNVVVQFMDKTGKVVSQYPPENYLEMMKELNKVSGELFHKQA